MKDKSNLSKDDKTYLLKMIMIAELNKMAYVYLARNQNVLTQIEEGKIEDFPLEYMEGFKDKDGKVVPISKNEREVLDKVLHIIRMPPLSRDIQVELSRIFELVGYFEEPLPETRKFNQLAGKNPTEALKFLRTIEWDFDTRLNSLTAEISQEVGQITFDPATADEKQQLLLTRLRNKVKTELLVFKEYLLKELFSVKVKDISPQFFETFLTLGDKLSAILIDFENEFLNHALILASEKFWQEFLAIPKFSEFSNFNQMVENLNKEKLSASGFVKPILEKTLSFLDPKFDEVILLIKDKLLLKVENSSEFHKQLAIFFTNQGDVNRRSVLFDLFIDNPLTLEGQILVLDDLIAKADYPKLNKSLDNENLIKTLSSKKAEEFRNFLIAADLNNQEFLNLFTSVWREENIGRFNLLKTDFFTNLTQKLWQAPNIELKKQYVDRLTDLGLKDFIVKSGAQKIYIDGLETIKTRLRGTRQSPEAKLKAKITRFQNKLKGGERRAKGSTRRARKPTKRTK